MNSKIIRLNLLMTWMVVATVFCAVSVAWAGPLDRGEMQPRHNPAANSMLRVPGVLGQSERYALEMLQRAGLIVNATYIRKSMDKYAGRNGTVVKQIPSAGGMAMLGSSVTITIYKVKGEPIDDSGGGYGGSGGGTGASDGGYGDSGGGGYDGAGDDYGDSSGGYGDSGGSGYGGAGDGYGGSGGGGYDGAGDDYDGSDDSSGDSGSASDDGSSGPDWSSLGSDSGGDGSTP